jgi:hypothetical protein
MAGENIQVNGIDFNDAFSTLTEYEPLDERLRQETNSLQQKVQKAIVKVTKKRKQFPLEADSLNKEILTAQTESINNSLLEIPPPASFKGVDDFLKNVFDLDKYEAYCKDQLTLVSVYFLNKATRRN